MKLLFDEHCAGTYKGSKVEIEKNFSAICVGCQSDLPAGGDDLAILEYAKKMIMS